MITTNYRTRAKPVRAAATVPCTGASPLAHCATTRAYHFRAVTRSPRRSASSARSSISGVAFSADGRTLYFVRGGGPNRAGEIPNPTSDPNGAEEAIWRVRLDGSPAARLTEGSSPTPAPRGSSVAFLRRGAIWIATAAGEAARVRVEAQLTRWRLVPAMPLESAFFAGVVTEWPKVLPC